MAEPAGAYIVPTMQITQEDLHELQTGTLPCKDLADSVCVTPLRWTHR
jgi:hypothetical protein